MKVLYITRSQTRKHRTWKKVLQQQLLGYPLSGQDGFFEASLWTAFPDLDVVSFEQACKMAPTLDLTHDWIILNVKYFPKGNRISLQDLSWLKSLQNCRKALFVNTARAHDIPEERLLDLFDVIFKRELLKDLDRYPVGPNTKRKLHVTMLSCPLIRAYVSKFSNNVVRKESTLIKGEKHFKHDVSFIGADSNPLRRTVLKELIQSSINFYGGLYNQQNGHPLDWDGAKHPLQKRSQYMQTIAQSKINLVLDGKGQFTYRHLEIWCAGSFMLSTPSILEVQLPGGTPEDGVHFACFHDYKELKEKISYYLENEAERMRIALAGSEFFKSIYDYSAHGRYITDVLHKY